jgi:hypothetical protein
MKNAHYWRNRKKNVSMKKNDSELLESVILVVLESRKSLFDSQKVVPCQKVPKNKIGEFIHITGKHLRTSDRID